MDEATKEEITIASAIVLLISGVVMCFCGFFMSINHSVNSSVLFYFGQCLIYAASVFGITSYLRFHDKTK